MKETQIMIGGHLEMVPYGYIQAESKFTEDETCIFEALDSGKAKELARTKVLEKRVEFYQLFLSGQVVIEQLAPKKKTWKSYLRVLIGEKWPD